MNTRPLNTLLFAVTPLLLLAAQTCLSQDNPDTPQNETSRPLVYSVCAGGCSRSMRVVATHTEFGPACEAVHKIRQAAPDKNWVLAGVMTGKDIHPYLVHPSVRSSMKPVSCSVARKGIRCGNWFIHSDKLDLKSAEKQADEIRKSGQFAEVICHFPN